MVLHFRPTSVPQGTLRFSLTWGLGGMAATLVLLQLGSGVMLKFFYEPTPVAAFSSVRTLIDSVPFGRLIRNLHHWCAHLLVAVMILHMLRVFYTGAFHPPRQFNWVIGLGLVATVLGANFTGYLLPWDQLAFWAVTVSASMLDYVPLVGGGLQTMIRSGGEVGPGTLRTFFALHTAVIPVVLPGLMAFHFWRVRKAKGVVVPRRPDAPGDPEPVRAPTFPDLLLREATMALVVIALVLLLSAIIDAPLGEQANPGLSPNPTRAPWYFAGLQELLLHLHPVFAVSVIPALVLSGLLAIPYLGYAADTGGVWFASQRGLRSTAIAAVMGVALTSLMVVVDAWLSAREATGETISPAISRGLLPLLLFAAIIAGITAFVKKRYGATSNETVQVVFTLLLAAATVLTITGVWFRGAGMALTVPW